MNSNQTTLAPTQDRDAPKNQLLIFKNENQQQQQLTPLENSKTEHNRHEMQRPELGSLHSSIQYSRFMQNKNFQNFKFGQIADEKQRYGPSQFYKANQYPELKSIHSSDVLSLASASPYAQFSSNPPQLQYQFNHLTKKVSQNSNFNFKMKSCMSENLNSVLSQILKKRVQKSIDKGAKESQFSPKLMIPSPIPCRILPQVNNAQEASIPPIINTAQSQVMERSRNNSIVSQLTIQSFQNSALDNVSQARSLSPDIRKSLFAKPKISQQLEFFLSDQCSLGNKNDHPKLVKPPTTDSAEHAQRSNSALQQVFGSLKARNMSQNSMQQEKNKKSSFFYQQKTMDKNGENQDDNQEAGIEENPQRRKLRIRAKEPTKIDAISNSEMLTRNSQKFKKMKNQGKKTQQLDVLDNSKSQLEKNLMYSQTIKLQSSNCRKRKRPSSSAKTNKSSRKKKQITRCPHTDQAHYAKGMCNHCYHLYGRSSLATKCPHTDRMTYAKGMCQNCYFNTYNKDKKQQKQQQQKEVKSDQVPS